MINGTLILFPKYAAYDNKHTIDKKRIQSVVNDKLSILLKYVSLTSIIMEDKLACELTKDIKPNMITVLKPITQLHFTDSEIVPTGYMSITKGVPCPREYTQLAETKIKINNKDSDTIDAFESKARVISCINKRVRFAASLLATNEFKSVLIFYKKNHMFCNMPIPEDFDSKIIQICDIYTGLSNYYYSGAKISEEDYYAILEEIIT